MARDEAQDMTAPTSIDIMKNAATMMSSTSLGDADITPDQKFHGATCHRQVIDIMKSIDIMESIDIIKNTTPMWTTSLGDIDIAARRGVDAASLRPTRNPKTPSAPRMAYSLPLDTLGGFPRRNGPRWILRCSVAPPVQTVAPTTPR
jgi:hypothetical protein